MKNDNSTNSQVAKPNSDSENHDKLPEAVVGRLLTVYDMVNLMSMKQIISKLKCFRLDTQGSENDLRQNLKSSYREILLSSRDLSLSTELLPYYIVIDFEATCTEVNPPQYRHEIIEFPAVLVNSRKQEIVDCFQMYCKPQINPILTDFCTELTGITQEQVDSAESFDKVMVHFQKWLSKHQLGSKHKYCIVTDGPFDMSRFLYGQCHYLNIKFPRWANEWVNLRKSFSKFYKKERLGLKDMLDYLGMEFTGRLHCGLDDAKNIARILLRMIYDGANIQVNERITGSKKNQSKTKGGTKSSNATKNDGAEENGVKTMDVRIEAHYKTVYSEEMPVYARKRRERLIAETQLARKILKNANKKESKKEKPRSE